MTKREIILVVIIVLVVIGFGATWFWQSASTPIVQAPVASKQPVALPPPPLPVLTPPSVATPLLEYPQLSLKTMSREEAETIYVERLRKDPGFEGKVVLSFYGKVVDENSQPVPAATVHLQWNTIGVPGGTAFAETTSDGNGLFSLTRQHGKILEVRVEKEGYYPVDHGNGTMFFEYAEPASSEWYEPDSNNPVIFHLRRKGEGAKLFSKSFDVPLNNDHPQDRVNLMQGFIKPDGVLTLTCDTSHALPGAQPYPWTFGLSMAEGGLVETDEQFPFLAPSSGYVPSITIHDDNLDRNVWQGGVKKTYYFYLPSTNTYGRLTVDKVASLSVVTLNYVYNLAPGNRILEPASK